MGKWFSKYTASSNIWGYLFNAFCEIIKFTTSIHANIAENIEENSVIDVANAIQCNTL